MNIDYNLIACIEYQELKGLISYLEVLIDPSDRMVIVLDKYNTNDNMIQLLSNSPPFVIYGGLIDCKQSWFRGFDNVKKLCKNEVLFGLCPDEIPSKTLIRCIKPILQENTTIDALAIPRINIFTDLTPEKASKMYTGDRPQNFLLEEPINEKGWHCWPDYQVRIIRNKGYIQYGPNTHDGLIGYKNLAVLPAEEQYALTHIKTVEHQERMLKVYDNIH